MPTTRTDVNEVYDNGNVVSSEQVEVDVTSDVNSRTIEDRLRSDLTDLQAIIDDTNANINANPAARIKTVARVQRRLIRRALAAYDATD